MQLKSVVLCSAQLTIASESMDVLILCTLALLPFACHAAHDLSQEYPFRATLLERGENFYELYWSFDTDLRNITFAVRVNTTGWVGFGLSPNGGMEDSDIVIGWVNGTGTGFFNVSSSL